MKLSTENKEYLQNFFIEGFIFISTLLVLTLIGYIAKGLVETIWVRDFVQVIFPLFGLIIKGLESYYEYKENLNGKS